MPRLGSRAALAAYLSARIGQVVESDELQRAANGAVEWAQRLRELRAGGWQISSHKDRADLKPGQYVLETAPPPDSYRFSSAVSGRVRAAVLERNGYTCQMCGAAAGQPDDQNPGRTIRLHVGHIVDRSHGGSDDPSNLRALCSTCNQGAQNLVQEAPIWIWLLSQIRRASVHDQQKALEWLKQKFGQQT